MMNRRTFLATAAGSACALAVPVLPSGALAALSARKGQLVPAGRKMRIAAVGVGGKGYSDLRQVAGEEIVALCDVDAARASRTFREFSDVPRFSDFRKMLVEMDDQIDGITVSTPDHMHFAVAMMAVRMGKHVFVQKPLTRTLWEARQLRLAAKEAGVITNMGNQGHAGEGVRLLKEWLDAGAIGEVREVHCWTPKLTPRTHVRPTDTPPVPSTLDWNAWLGVAPYRPYHPEYVPFNWRSWWEYGCGALGDIGCHTMDGPYYALGLGAPESVEIVEMSKNYDDTPPDKSIVRYNFPARGGKPPVTFTWYDGGHMPPRPKELEKDRKLSKCGYLCYGDKGVIYDGTEKCSSPRIIPETQMRQFLPKRPPKTIPRVKDGPQKEWVAACKGGPLPGSNFEYAGPLTEMVLLGNLAKRVGRKITWDAEALKCPNAPEADRFIREPFRVF
jgi:predicted dehydrogenase